MAQRQTLFQKLAQNTYKEETTSGSLRYSIKFKILIIAATVVIGSLFFSFHLDSDLLDRNDTGYNIGHKWTSDDLEAEFSYPVYKTEDQLLAEREQTLEAALQIFIFDNNASAKARSAITDYINNLANRVDSDLGQHFTERALARFYSLPENERSRELYIIQNSINSLLGSAYRLGFVNVSLEQIEGSEIIVKMDETNEKLIKKTALYDYNRVIEEARSLLYRSTKDQSRDVIYEILQKLNYPNLKYSQELTEKSRELAVESVPKTKGIVRKGEVIIRKGDRITQDDMDELRSYQSSRYLRNVDYYSPLNYLGSLGHCIIIFSILLIYLAFLRKKIFYDNHQLLALSAIFIITGLMAWLSMEIQTSLPLQYLIFVPAMSMLAAIIFDSRTAFYVTVTLAFLVAGIRGNDYITAITMLVTGALAAYTVRDIQNRTQMFQSMFFIFITLAATILVFGLERSADIMNLVRRLVIALINSAVSPLMAYGMLLILERSVNIASDLKLQEFNNLNHPLMIKMSELAPGTYQHTLSVAMLAERCAGAINANAMLTKTGAYFHDIGKIAKPEYFVENQSDIQNKHDLMSPRKSAQAIKDHVLAGIEMGRQYHLPERIIDFIPQHHGTTLIKHFYAKAIEEGGAKEIIQDDYRYPGPKPQSREAAILMICDSAEAISRIEGKTKEEIEHIIDGNIQDRLLDGQFDECDITIHELQIVKETIVKNMMGVTHKRTSYKEIPKDKP